MTMEALSPVNYAELSGSQIEFLDSGGILHIKDYWGSRAFLDSVASLVAPGSDQDDFSQIFVSREVPSLASLGTTTKHLKRLVHNHAFAMAMTPLIEAIGCDLDLTHIDCGVIRYQLLNNLRAAAEASEYFEKGDFARLTPRDIPEIFGYDKLPPHRDVRWPHIRILGFWMTLTDLEEGEALTMFPEVFAKAAATGDPSKERFPANNDPNTFGMGRPISPAMKAGDVLAFHAATVHSSPPRQAKTFRGSIDFRVAFPCLDDFKHYKATFVQAHNLVHYRDKLGPVSPVKQRLVIDSMIRELTVPGSGAGLSMWERRVAMERSGERVTSQVALRHAVLGQFCPDSFMWMLGRAASETVQYILLTSFLFRSQSYFWLFNAYLAARLLKFSALAQRLKQATSAACQTTKLPIKNFPIEWRESPRELPPELVLQKLAEV